MSRLPALTVCFAPCCSDFVITTFSLHYIITVTTKWCHFWSLVSFFIGITMRNCPFLTEWQALPFHFGSITFSFFFWSHSLRIWCSKKTEFLIWAKLRVSVSVSINWLAAQRDKKRDAQS